MDKEIFIRNLFQLMAVEHPRHFIRLSKMLGKFEGGNLDKALYVFRESIGESPNYLQITNRVLNQESQLVPLRRKILKRILKRTMRGVRRIQEVLPYELR